MACRLVAAKPLSEPMLENFKRTLGNQKPQWNFYQNLNIFIQENALEYCVWKMVAILWRLQCVHCGDVWVSLWQWLTCTIQKNYNHDAPCSRHRIPHKQYCPQQSGEMSSLEVLVSCIYSTCALSALWLQMSWDFRDNAVWKIYVSSNLLCLSVMPCISLLGPYDIKQNDQWDFRKFYGTHRVNLLFVSWWG